MEQDIEKIMVRTLTGEASTDDIVILSEWLSLREENKTVYQKASTYWHACVSVMTPLNDKDRTYEQLLKRIRKPKRQLRLPVWLRYAGVAVLVLSLAGVAHYHFPARENVEQHYSLLSGTSISSFQLPDSTEVTLNANSMLRYSEAFGDWQRDVHLQGEAFFHVAKDMQKKFVVHLNEDTRVVALGTSFNVSFDPDENTLSTTLVEGSIRFEASGQTVTLTPNQQLLYNLADRKISIVATDSELATAWKDHLIKYKSIPFSEALTLLEKQYTVNIKLTNEDLGRRKVSGTFDRNLPVEQVLDMMKKSLSFDWQEKDGYYLIIK
jgi:ferric-dicitrate binding protein FerR (iron transport regulator)